MTVSISKPVKMNKYQTASIFLFRSTINKKVYMRHMSSAVTYSFIVSREKALFTPKGT